MRRGVRRVVLLAVVATAAGSPAAFAQVARQPAAGAGAGAQDGAVQAPAAKAKPRAAAEPARAIPPDPRMKKLLAEWEKQSAKLKTLDVKIRRLDTSPAWGDEEFKGRALLESPNHAWLDFKKVDVDANGNQKLVAFERIICTGTEVWQYKPESKQIFIFPLDKQIQKRALEVGPLPFLFNMKAAEAEARYEMALANEVKTAWVISVVPRLRVDQEAFSKAFVNLRRDTYMPDRIFLISPDGKSTKDFKLSEVKTNVPIAQANFVGKDPGPPWQVIRDPAGGVPEPKAQGVAKQQAPVAPAPNALPPRRTAVAPRRPPAN